MEQPDLPRIPLPIANGKTLQPFQFSTKPGQGSSLNSASKQPPKPMLTSTPFPVAGSSSDSAFTFAPPIQKETSESAKAKDSTPPPMQVSSSVDHGCFKLAT